jgi:hypothetical protein
MGKCQWKRFLDYLNTWGQDWGQKGYGKIAFKESTIDLIAISFMINFIPDSMKGDFEAF